MPAMSFIARSGNACKIKLIARNDKAVIDLEWDRAASRADMEDAEHTIKTLFDADSVESVVEEDDAKRATLTRKHLGGGVG